MIPQPDRRSQDQLRRLGYRVRAPQPSDTERLLKRLGLRMAPLNRVRPSTGSWYGTCPSCGVDDALWIEPDGELHFLCGCVRGPAGLVELLGLLLRQGSA